MYTKQLSDTHWLSDCKKLLDTVGFCIVENILSLADCQAGTQALDKIYPLITQEIGLERLEAAGEVGILRAPMKYSPYFMRLLENKFIQALVDAMLSDTSILHLQNGFIFPSQERDNVFENFQYTFHPDFPRYLNGYVASLNALITLTDIHSEDEIFYVVPGTHQQAQKFDNDFCKRNQMSISAKAGSVLFFDSTLWHCGGANYSGKNWYGINHQYTRSYFKQQLDYVRVLGENLVIEQQPRVQQLLGYYTRVVTCLDEYYQPEEKRLYRKGQG
ncbi:Phytanoyl-CoA dioxygenase (PhyH) [Legionella quinlivanii]|uniref:Phytanoyl-CoA dioxygenase (PhyH) n=1 Tax=Legionella quinlivanii TaxID=45073 RepID=A0A0W0Y4L8_9GAMM|nr:phytanoyl-CoA dioxygenase family protein [Legionella quinlivanii]KTD51953.1 Phytanoyl-CoA dioxygenase (PhyH) [Legionella quinlivanii]SEF85727.1 Ectoine hydroxylase-related dioxygenase, phytanoyl-CoA dioxygenase (PhyH) family [Legionella quinlivanii DSM 21216]STY09584.1 Phytanoyl-CoA dioxygenase (PhyH) [Legionella quinlivanii]